MANEITPHSNMEIWVVPAAGPAISVSGEKGLGTASGDKGLAQMFRAPVKLDVQTLGNNLRDFVGSLKAMISQLPAVGDPFRLDEIEIAVELTAEGSFQLIGGAKVGVTGGLTLKLKRAS